MGTGVPAPGGFDPEQTLELQAPEGHEAEGHSYLSFINADRSNAGALIQTPSGGCQLRSANGDIAEAHCAAPGEGPFEEGDVVGMWPNPDPNENLLLKLQTVGAVRAGVISVRASMVGSVKEYGIPSSTVAQIGQVPVRMQQGARCKAGDQLVASGQNDGTVRLGSISLTPPVFVLAGAVVATNLMGATVHGLVSSLRVTHACAHDMAQAVNLRSRRNVLFSCPRVPYHVVATPGSDYPAVTSAGADLNEPLKGIQMTDV